MRLQKPLRKWGNAFGIMVSKAEAQRIGIGPGDIVDAEVTPHRVSRVQDLPAMGAGIESDIEDALRRDLDAGG